MIIKLKWDRWRVCSIWLMFLISTAFAEKSRHYLAQLKNEDLILKQRILLILSDYQIYFLWWVLLLFGLIDKVISLWKTSLSSWKIMAIHSTLLFDMAWMWWLKPLVKSYAIAVKSSLQFGWYLSLIYQKIQLLNY